MGTRIGTPAAVYAGSVEICHLPVQHAASAACRRCCRRVQVSHMPGSICSAGEMFCACKHSVESSCNRPVHFPLIFTQQAYQGAHVAGAVLFGVLPLALPDGVNVLLQARRPVMVPRVVQRVDLACMRVLFDEGGINSHVKLVLIRQAVERRRCRDFCSVHLRTDSQCRITACTRAACGRTSGGDPQVGVRRHEPADCGVEREAVDTAAAERRHQHRGTRVQRIPALTTCFYHILPTCQHTSHLAQHLG